MGVVDMHWQVQQVKQRLSEVLRAAETSGPQYVTRHGTDVAVVVSIDDFHRLRAADEPKPSLLEALSTGRDIGLTNEEIDAFFARDRRVDTGRETLFVGPEWE